MSTMEFARKKIWILILSGLFVAFFFRGYLDAFQNNINNYVFSCTDFGQYLSDIRNYKKEGVMLKEAVEVGREPHLFLLTSTWQRIAGVGDDLSLIWLTAMFFLLTILTAYIFLLKITGDTRICFIGTILIWFAFLQWHAFTFHNTRQLLWQLFLYILAYSATFFPRKILVNGFLLWGCMLTHRLSMLFWGWMLLLSIPFNKKNIKGFVWTLIFWFVITLPNTYLNLWSFLDTITWYVDVLSWKINTIWEVRKVPKEEMFWWSWITRGGDIEKIPLWTYVKLVPVFIVFILANFKRTFFLYRKTKVVNVLFLIIFSYISARLIFSNRVLIWLEWITIFFLVLNLKAAPKWPYKSILVSWLIFFSFVIINKNGHLIQRKVMYRVDTDKSVQFLKNRGDGNGYYFGSHCTSDLLWQISMPSAYNSIRIPVFGMTWIGKTDINFYTFADISWYWPKAFMEKPYVHELLKGKGIFTVLSKKLGDWDFISKIEKGQLNYDIEKNAELIYKWSWDDVFNYIFEIKKEKIKFYDSKNYFDLNIKALYK